MGKQLANGDVLLTIGGKLGQIFRNRIVQAKAALLVELHDGRRGGQDFGQRGKIEDSVFGHGFGRRYQRTVAVRLMKDDVPVVPGDDHRPRKLLRRDAAFDNAIDLPELRVLRLQLRNQQNDEQHRDFRRGFSG